MKRTFSLLGLLFVGVTLLVHPSTGILSGTAAAATPIAGPVITTGEPPRVDDPEGSEPAPSTTTTAVPARPVSVSVVGSAVQSRFGPFQVEAVIENGVLVDVVPLQIPGDRRSTAINNRAIPRYEAAVLEAQSASVDVISGATVTWQGYLGSLESALEQAGLT